MWAFIITEILFFGGALAAFYTYHRLYPLAFAQASHHLNVALGFVNTGVLLCSSLSMALAVRAAQLGDKRTALRMMVLTLILGSAFLGIKFYEWSVEYQEGLVPFFNWTNTEIVYPQERLFWVAYFCLTGLHALHMIIGAIVLTTLIVLLARDWMSGTGSTQIEMFGLYWHLVDIVWVFLYPLLYLINLQSHVVAH
jgi:cytochrome c oxidase subunit 3